MTIADKLRAARLRRAQAEAAELRAFVDQHRDEWRGFVVNVMAMLERESADRQQEIRNGEPWSATLAHNIRAAVRP